jgi:hypothetical protein
VGWATGAGLGAGGAASEVFPADEHQARIGRRLSGHLKGLHGRRAGALERVARRGGQGRVDVRRRVEHTGDQLADVRKGARREAHGEGRDDRHIAHVHELDLGLTLGPRACCRGARGGSLIGRFELGDARALTARGQQEPRAHEPLGALGRGRVPQELCCDARLRTFAGANALDDDDAIDARHSPCGLRLDVSSEGGWRRAASDDPEGRQEHETAHEPRA